MNVLAVTWSQTLVVTLFTIVCLLLMLVILLQKGRGGGLSGAFGGAGGHSAFGAKTGDVFTWITVALTGLFVLMAVLGNYVMTPTMEVSNRPAVAAPGEPEVPADDAASSETPATQPG